MLLQAAQLLQGTKQAKKSLGQQSAGLHSDVHGSETWDIFFPFFLHSSLAFQNNDDDFMRNN